MEIITYQKILLYFENESELWNLLNHSDQFQEILFYLLCTIKYAYSIE